MDKKRKRNRLIPIVLALIILAILTSGTWWLFSSGHLVYHGSISQPNNLSSNQTVVCDAYVVAKYNDAMDYKERNGSTEPSIDIQAIKNLVADIKAKTNFKSDPTCQAIIFWSAVMNDNYKAASIAYNELLGLHKKHIFADSNLLNDQPLFTYKEALDGLTGSGAYKSGSFGG